MPIYADQVHKLLKQAQGLPPCGTSLELLQTAASIADAHNDVGLGMEARRPLMWVARNLLRGDILTAAFTWCLAQQEREPGRHDCGDLLWEQSMVIGQLANLPDVSRATLEALLDHFRRRLEAAGASLRPLHETRYHIAPDLGDRTMAESARAALRGPRAAPYEYNDDAYDEINVAVFLGEDDRCMLFADLLLGGQFRGSSAELSSADLLVPLLRHGRLDDAKKLLKRAFRAYHPERVYYWPYGGILKALTLLGELKRALKVYSECQRAITPECDPLTRLHFALDAMVLFDRLVDVGRKDVSLRRPELVAVPHEGNRYRVEDLRAWLRQEAMELAERFDARNGTEYFRGQVGERTELQRLAMPIELA
jgi:tetratricopeptide (TPR) repeat protein